MLGHLLYNYEKPANISIRKEASTFISIKYNISLVATHKDIQKEKQGKEKSKSFFLFYMMLCATSI